MAVLVADNTNTNYVTDGLTKPTIAVAGSGYSVADILTLTGPTVGATVTVATIDGSGGVTSVTLTTRGSGHTQGTTYATTYAGAGTNCTITASVCQSGFLSTTNGFYTSGAYNVGSFHGTVLGLSITRTIAVTFANADNCSGIVLSLYTGTTISTRPVTVTLQQFVGAVWTDTLATTTLTAASILHSTIYPHGVWITPFKFTTPVAVSTAASTWRFSISQGAGTGDFNLMTSDATNPAFVSWGDTVATATSNADCIVAADKVTVDKTFILKGVLGTGDTTKSVCAIICKGPDGTPDNVSLMEWENPNVGAYTLTTDGLMVLGVHSGFRAGASANRVSGTFVVKQTPTLGSASNSGPCGAHFFTTASIKMSFFIYGTLPAKQYATLTAEANSGQKVLAVDDASWLAPGDTVYVGRENVIGTGNGTIGTIDTIVGNNITLLVNLAGQNRLVGGKVISFNHYGFVLKSDSTTTAILRLTWPSNLQLSGVCTQFVNNYPSSQYALYPDDTGCMTEILFEDCYFYGSNPTGNASYYNNFYMGLKFSRCNFLGATLGYVGTPGPEKYFTVDSCYLNHYGGVTECIIFGLTTTMKNVITNNEVSNCSGGGILMTGVSSVYTNNFVFGTYSYAANYMGGFHVTTLINPTISGNSVNKSTIGLLFAATGVSVNAVAKTMSFGQISANTSDINTSTGQFIDFVLVSPTGAISVSETNISYWFEGSKISITDYAGTANDNRNWYKYGYIRSTGDGLTDTTVHTAGAGKYAMRFENISSSENLDWEFTVPTGDITGLDMIVAVWVKISNAAFYGGTTYELPRLTVNYDNGTLAYAQAAESTDWQLLLVPITPATSYGQLTVTLSTKTDQTTTNAYVYWDDMSVLYPAGYTLNLGGFDLWADGVPITPPIATSISALDVWSAATSSLTGAGTVGKLITDLLTTGRFLALK